jgi:hypothetical protein
MSVSVGFMGTVFSRLRRASVVRKSPDSFCIVRQSGIAVPFWRPPNSPEANFRVLEIACMRPHDRQRWLRESPPQQRVSAVREDQESFGILMMLASEKRRTIRLGRYKRKFPLW